VKSAFNGLSPIFSPSSLISATLIGLRTTHKPKDIPHLFDVFGRGIQVMRARGGAVKYRQS
jgi:hypothetical protein